MTFYILEVVVMSSVVTTALHMVLLRLLCHVLEPSVATSQNPALDA